MTGISGCWVAPFIRRASYFDQAEISRIDNESTAHPWSDEEWKRETTVTGAGLMVAARKLFTSSRLAGFISFAADDQEIVIRRIVTDIEVRRSGVARSMLRKLDEIGSEVKRVLAQFDSRDIEFIRCVVPESRLDVQCTLRACGYKCTRTIRNMNDGEDHYEFKKAIS